MKTIIIALLLGCFLFAGCNLIDKATVSCLPNYEKKYSTLRLPNHATAGNGIRYDGFYAHTSYYETSDKVDTIFALYFFYEDGSFIWICRNDISNEFKKNVSKNISTWRKGDRWNHNCGVYAANQDTINMEYYGHSYSSFYKLTIKKFLITDEKHIRHISQTYFDKGKPWTKAKDDDYYFVQADSIPPPYCFIKQEKWIWKDKHDWKNYMEKKKHRSEQEH